MGYVLQHAPAAANYEIGHPVELASVEPAHFVRLGSKAAVKLWANLFT
jgi:hypothetical protein